eukprot:scaffold5208_cov154-Isochrysis_galbana.AAC.2
MAPAHGTPHMALNGTITPIRACIAQLWTTMAMAYGLWRVLHPERVIRMRWRYSTFAGPCHRPAFSN